MKRNKTAEEELEVYRAGARRTIESWRTIAANGCTDPFHADGVSMNLLRNHLIAFKRDMREVCGNHGIDLPREAFYPDLSYVDQNYFANPNSERAKRIMKQPYWRCFNHESPRVPIYDESALALF